MKNNPATGLSNDDGDGNKNVNEAIGLGPVHTNTFSFENAYISKGLGLPFTLNLYAERKHRLENVLESGSKRKHITTYRRKVEGRKRSKTHQNENDDRNIAGACL